MEKTRKILYIILCFIAGILAIGSILSIFRDTESRYLKMLDFMRIQFFITSVLSLVLLIIVTKKWFWYGYLVLSGLLIGLIVNGSYLINYTPLVSVEVSAAKDTFASGSQLRLLLINVKMSNNQAQPLINLIELKKPDLILGMEVNEWWSKQFESFKDEYPYSIKAINDVTYGMVLYSKFPLESSDVSYLNNRKVPSFESTVSLPNGQKISFHALHPVPPTHFEDLPDNEGQQESAMKILGDKVSGRTYPTIVAGDMNDVVWSHVDALTLTENLLYDVRVGRGFYNSFNANNIFMRWPLDHVFVTKEFRLKALERLSKIGSDHFPMFVTLVLQE
ncbi:endonuclease/exonuclease/phosphatase (EEP) superfamily protein YafD [Gelidibacter algens]|uniref:Endonuclease/exonuclease/phosphatase (EEP) superfamily protein YafD n=1 Tax=Gelidibacter algens TaxID=49280 RepID=A0A1A7R3I4_9FLAO|nr:endonuclease/exonuclease/phosphatase family protein [Gelidibacter algens]OBX26024.1 hypothetical protein A9996_06840 [Gelidibacter algens]RAJ27709.1 endonuclease/exonuclease/phosphatase (EEP) superfamily protein YafD [Gelidibacter algens]